MAVAQHRPFVCQEQESEPSLKNEVGDLQTFDGEQNKESERQRLPDAL